MTDRGQAGQRPRICLMTHTSARASPGVVRAQHANGRPIKSHGASDWLKSVKHSQQPTLRKTSGPARRDGRASTSLGHAGGRSAREQRVAECADEPSSHHCRRIADDSRPRLSRGASGDVLATRQRRRQRHPWPLAATPEPSGQNPPPDDEGIGQRKGGRLHRTTQPRGTEMSSSALIDAVPCGSARKLAGPIAYGLISSTHHPSSFT